MKWKCIIADDTEVDNMLVASYVRRFDHLELAGAYTSPRLALAALEKGGIDVVFLDVDMPGISGLEVRRKALEVPACVFITSHPEYALEGFELEALDYIVKPLTFERFAKAAGRIGEFLDIRSKAGMFDASLGGDSIFIREGHDETKLKLSDIRYLEALKNYTIIVTADRKHRVLLNLGALLKEGHFHSFVRVHRGFAVQKHFVEKITARDVRLQGNFTVPVGRNYKDSVLQLICEKD